MSDKTSTYTNSAPRNGGSGPSTEFRLNVKRHEEFFFDDTLVAIQIEDTLFNVHKYQLLKSEVFSDMFKVPKAKDGKPEEGALPDRPIKMEGVKASDFTALLKVLYAGQFSAHQLPLTAPFIVPALRLANMWGFSELRSCLLPLAEKVLSDLDKIILARELGLEDWLAPAHLRLCQRREQITSQEAHKLGIDSLLLISRMREQNSSKDKRRLSAGYYCSNCSGFSGSNNSNNHYGSSSMMCKGCQAQGYNLAYYNGSGTVMMGTRSNTSLEAEVKKWVKDGCIFRD